jgi:hypothetical protein
MPTRSIGNEKCNEMRFAVFINFAESGLKRK